MDLKEEKQYYVQDEFNTPQLINDREFVDVNLESTGDHKDQVSFDQNDKQNTHATMLDTSKTDVKAERRSIFKNVLVICFAFMLLFTAFGSMSALQSSINKVV